MGVFFPPSSYLLSDAVCQLFDIQLTERHIPTRAVEEKAYSVTVFKVCFIIFPCTQNMYIPDFYDIVL